MVRSLLVSGFSAICLLIVNINSAFAQPEVLRLGLANTSESPEEKAVRYRLQQPISFHFKDTPFEEAVEAMSLYSGVPIRFDRRAIAVARIRLDMPVKEKLADERLCVALDRLLRPRGLRFVVAKNVIVITTPFSESLVRKSYSVCRFLTPGNNTRELELLRQFVQKLIASNRWEENGGDAAIQYFPEGKTLVINQTEEHHEEIAQLFAAMRKLYDLTVNVRVSLVFASPKSNESWQKVLANDAKRVPVFYDKTPMPSNRQATSLVQRNLDRYYVPVSNPTVALAYGCLTDRQVKHLLETTSDDTESDIQHAPRFEVFNGQRNFVEWRRKVNAVIEMRVPSPIESPLDVLANSVNGPIANPTLSRDFPFDEKVISAWRCEVTPAVSPDRKSLKTSVNFEHFISESKRATVNRISAARVFEMPSGSILIWSLGEVQGTVPARRQHLFLVVAPVVVDRSQEP